MKKIQFVTQAKGGAGKSVLTFLLAEKNPDAGIIDMNDATKTSMTQLAYRKPDPVTFLSSNRTIDRGLFSDFLEEISEAETPHFICDLGASISEQLPEYFRDNNPKILAGLISELKMTLELLVVIAGENMFKASMNYLEDLYDSTKENIIIKIAVNNHYSLDEAQQKVMLETAKKYKIPVSYFNISPDTNDSTQKRIKAVLKSGLGVSAASAFTKIPFQSAIENLSL